MAKIVKNVRRVRKNEKTLISDAYELFLLSRYSRCAQASIEIYQEKQKPIVIGFTEQNISFMEDITPASIREILSLYRETHTNNGAWKLFTYIRTFLRWYWNEHDLEHCPITKVDPPKVNVVPKQGITREEINKILKAIKEISYFPERDTVVIMLLADTGLRKKSILSLSMKDVDLKNNSVFVFEKDQNYHTKIFGNATAKAIRNYLACLDDVKPEDPFIISRDAVAMNDDSLRLMMKRVCQYAGIENHQCHDFRRFYGLELYRATNDIYFVSRMLDHKDVEVTKRYLAITDIEDAAAMAKVSPMDQGKTGIKINRK